MSIIFHASDQFLHFEPCLSPPLLCLFDEADVVNSPIVRVFIFFSPVCTHNSASLTSVAACCSPYLLAEPETLFQLYIFLFLFIQNYTPLLMQLIDNEKQTRVCVINVMDANGVH